VPVKISEAEPSLVPPRNVSPLVPDKVSRPWPTPSVSLTGLPAASGSLVETRFALPFENVSLLCTDATAL
jgi:hypothetical protein